MKFGYLPRHGDSNSDKCYFGECYHAKRKGCEKKDYDKRKHSMELAKVIVRWAIGDALKFKTRQRNLIKNTISCQILIVGYATQSMSCMEDFERSFESMTWGINHLEMKLLRKIEVD